MSVPANIYDTYTAVALPATSEEAVIAELDAVSGLVPALNVNLHGWVDLKPASSSTVLTLRVRRNSLTGTQVGADVPVGFITGANTTGQQLEIDVQDQPGDFAAATYVLTLQATSAAGVASAVRLHFGAVVC